MKLTIEQKVGQLMIIGWQSDNVDDIIELIKTYHFGNIILFTRNIKSAAKLKIMTEKIQEAAILYNGYPAIIALDQEGGSVRRIYDGLTYVPGPMALAAASSENPFAALQAGLIMGEELNYVGVNLNLAPIVDINSNPYNPVIGIRAFSDDPLKVSKLAMEFSMGLEENHVIPTYKHFIGHGNVSVDSHLDLPRIDTPLKDLYTNELVPYLNKGYQPAAIMTAHILYTALDDRFPATVSDKILRGLLRKELNFNGLIITDCFEMDAISRSFSLNEAGVFAIKATADIVMVSHTFGRQMTVRNGIIDAVKSGDITMEELDARVDNVLSFKEKFINKRVMSVDFKKNQQISEKISLDSVTLVSGYPFLIDQDTVVIGVTNYLSSAAEDPNIEKVDVALEIGKEFGILSKSIDNKNFNVNEIANFVKGKKVVLALTDSHLTLIQKVLYSQLLQVNNKVMLISMRTPYDVLGLESPNCHYAVYEYTKQSINALIKVLKGESAKGVLPVKLSIEGKTNEHQYKNKLIREVISIIEKDYAKNLSLDYVSNEVMISKEHLSRLFKKVTNRNFNEYLLMVRINHAMEHLRNSTLRIYEIGYICGFPNANYFTKRFKSVVGLTPQEYRDNI